MSTKDAVPEADWSPFMKQQVEKKQRFRDALCQKVSILRLGYLLKMLKGVHPQKASMLPADSFKLKMMKLDLKDKKQRERLQVGVSSDSVATKKSGNLLGSMDSAAIKEEQRTAHLADPILEGINKFISTQR